jgi:hypothetical protein
VGGVSLDAAISRFRRRQADLFRDEATVSRPPTPTAGVISTTDNTFTPTAPTEVYDGPCLLRSFTWEGSDAQYGDIEIRLRRLRAKFPVDTDIRMDDVVVPTTSIHDESLVGVGFRVTDVFRDGWQISRVAILEEITP